MAKLILSRGAIVDTAYSDGSPLHIAAFYGKTNVMKVLLEHHAYVTDELYPSLLGVFCVIKMHMCLVCWTALSRSPSIKYLL